MRALTSEQARVRRRDHANFAPKSREKVAKFPEFRRTARTKFACIRPTYVTQATEPSLHLFTESEIRYKAKKARVKCRDHANLPRKSHEIIANFRKFGAPRAEKFLEISQHALCEPKNVVAAFKGVVSTSKCEKVRVWRRCHASFAPNSREEIAKFLEIRRAARTKTACTRPASRCACSQKRR